MCSFVPLLCSRRELPAGLTHPIFRGAAWSDELLQGTNLLFPPTDIGNTVNPLFLDNSKAGKKTQIKPQTLCVVKNSKLNSPLHRFLG